MEVFQTSKFEYLYPNVQVGEQSLSLMMTQHGILCYSDAISTPPSDVRVTIIQVSNIFTEKLHF